MVAGVPTLTFDSDMIFELQSGGTPVSESSRGATYNKREDTNNAMLIHVNAPLPP